MKKPEYTVFIPASGVGINLGDLTNFTNKTLLKVGKKPTLSYIIEAYPEDTNYIVTLGHFGEQVRDYLSLAHPERKITFVEVETYQGAGSSLAHTFLCAKAHLQKPFIYHASDTIIFDTIPRPDKDWVAGYKKEASSQYHSIRVIGTSVQKIDEKGSVNPDYLHVGLVGVKDFSSFWPALEEVVQDGDESNPSDVQTINLLLQNGKRFSLLEVQKWFDTGSTESLNYARREIEDSFHILDKSDETIFLFKDFVIKFFFNKEIAENRVKRAEFLKGLVPKMRGAKGCFYKYSYAPGDLLADTIQENNFTDFLDWSRNNLWKPSREVSKEVFQKKCLSFYEKKTRERVQSFFSKTGITDRENTVNGESMPSLESMLKRIDFDWLADGIQTHFHGDFILDNILQDGKNYILLDWRQDFAGLLESGDMYYDLSKLNHNLTLNHDILNKELFTLEIEGDDIKCDILRKNIHVQCQKNLHAYIETNSLDLKKVKMLTAIIWLNMSPLHQHPLDIFLFYFGKFHLWKALHDR